MRTFAMFLVWAVWALFRAGYLAFVWLAKHSVGHARRHAYATAVATLTPISMPPWFWVLKAVSDVSRWFSRKVAAAVDCCPLCFFEGQCPYHWSKYASPDYGRIFPTRRQRQAQRHANESRKLKEVRP